MITRGEAGLIKFARWAISESAWQGTDLDGGSVQNKALECGLVVETTYDPDKHGENDAGAEPGDPWFVFAPILTEK